MAHNADYFLNEEEYYYVLLLSEYLGYIACCSTSTAIDNTYFFLVEHICGMYIVLCHRLENLTARRKLLLINNDNVHGSSEVHQRVRHCIQLDERIGIFIDTMQSTFGMCFFFDIGLGIIFHTCTCVMIVLQAGQSSQIVRYVAILFLQSFRFFFNSWTGQEVINHSFKIAIAAYNGMWYDTPIEVQKMLMLLIAKSQKPSELTIAKFYVINLENFGAVMKTSTSYCTVMISLQEASEDA